MSTKNRFGFEWHRYSEITPLYEEQFLAWVSPWTPEDFQGKSVLDAGCGTGRNSIWPLRYGAEAVTAFDVDPRTVAVARKNLAEHPQATVEEKSIYEIGHEDAFDLAFSIGVVHHLERPRDAVAELVKATKPGGTTLVWVYGKEGHTGSKLLINGIRRVTCRLPPGLLHVLVYPLSALLFLYLKAFNHQHPYLKLFRKAHFWHVHSVIFDQLLPEISNYWTRDEAMALFDGLPVENVTAHFCNKGSWTVTAEKAG